MCDASVKVHFDSRDPARLCAEGVEAGRSYFVVRYPSTVRLGEAKPIPSCVTGWLVPGELLVLGFKLDRVLADGEELQVSLTCPVAFCDGTGANLNPASLPCAGGVVEVSACSVPPYPSPRVAYGVLLLAA